MTQKDTIVNQRMSTRALTLISLFAVLMIVGGKINLMVFSIPFTLQFLACLLTGLLLGARKGMAAIGIYIFLGLIGLPVFALGGGIGYVLLPSFGYLPGMLICAGLTGFLATRTDPYYQKITFIQTLLISLAGLGMVYLFGVTYLYFIRNFYVGEPMLFTRAIQIGMIPFLITDFAHCLLAALLAPRIRKAARSFLINANKTFAK